MSRHLPPPPAFLAPQPLPLIARGADARKVAGDHRRALVEANKRLAAGRSWYIQMVKEYGQ